MNNAELGKLIKEARISKKMTQSEVVGDFITRNMLSQIENGLASPSMRTLQYLAGILDLHINIEEMPVSDNRESFSNDCVSSDDTGKNFSADIEMLNRLSLYKKLLNEKCYGKVADGLEAINLPEDSLLYDEYCALTARSNYEYAKELADKGNHDAAIAHAGKATKFAAIGVYSNNDICAKSLLLSHEQIALLN